MHNGQKVVDVHGHMTTPAPFASSWQKRWRKIHQARNWK
jgi:hypothetical protein